MPSTPPARLIALYLPQFHPIPENDEWWGKGFTEWTNVAKARPLFPGHYQPHVPADLGFYDLRLPEVRIAQAELARRYGIEGFCYWHYWFAGRRLLDRPFNEVLTSRQPDFPFCLAWANESWRGVWHGTPNTMLVEQTYPGKADYTAHFEALRPAFEDPRHLRVDGKPIFLVYQPHHLPDPFEFTDTWRELAHQAGLPGMFLIACLHSEPVWDPRKKGFDAATIANQVKVMEIPPRSSVDALRRKALARYRRARKRPVRVYDYAEALPHFVQAAPPGIELYPTVVPNWDNSPRSGLRGFVLHDSTPELFARHLRQGIDAVGHLPADHRLVFVKSWNEWAEGNHLEPDLRHGHAYLQVVRDTLAAAGVDR